MKMFHAPTIHRQVDGFRLAVQLEMVTWLTIYGHCSLHIESSHCIYSANELIAFYVMINVALNRLPNAIIIDISYIEDQKE